MKTRTFAQIYCEREGLPAAELSARLFRLTLYPHARLVAALLRRFNPRHFLADYEFIEDVGHLRSLEDFSLVLGGFIEHPSNWGLLRRRFRIRVSARRMLRIVRTVYTPGTGSAPSTSRNTLEPFGERPAAPSNPQQKMDPASE